MKRIRIPAIAALSLSLFCIGSSARAAEPSSRTVVDDVGRAFRTLMDMRAIQTVVEAYAIDYRKYPAASTLSELRPLVEPVYIHTLPLTDAWGTAYRYLPSQDGQSYRLISAGSDRVFDEESWKHPGLLTSSKEDGVLTSIGPAADREWIIQR